MGGPGHNAARRIRASREATTGVRWPAELFREVAELSDAVISGDNEAEAMITAVIVEFERENSFQPAELDPVIYRDTEE